jgi:hypothetical protein
MKTGLNNTITYKTTIYMAIILATERFTARLFIETVEKFEDKVLPCLTPEFTRSLVKRVLLKSTTALSIAYQLTKSTIKKFAY